ncbi:MAG: roadblock/LC7 domain-containing protein [Promethearchaeota archaeon]
MVNLKEQEICNIMKDFRERTNILCSALFTEDGFIIAIDDPSYNIDEDFHQTIVAICAGIISLASEGVEIFKADSKITQITIQAGDQLDNEGFIIVLESITEEIRYSILFPTFLNLGVIMFELNQTLGKLSKFFLDVDLIDDLESVSTSP